MVRITKDKRHDILKDGIRIGFNTFNEARSYAKDFL